MNAPPAAGIMCRRRKCSVTVCIQQIVGPLGQEENIEELSTTVIETAHITQKQLKDGSGKQLTITSPYTVCHQAAVWKDVYVFTSTSTTLCNLYLCIMSIKSVQIQI